MLDALSKQLTSSAMNLSDKVVLHRTALDSLKTVPPLEIRILDK